MSHSQMAMTSVAVAPSASLPALDDSPITNPQQYFKAAPESRRVKRDDDRDLAFSGWRIGNGVYNSGPADAYGNAPRGTEVTIYVSVGGKFVVHQNRWSDRSDGRDQVFVAESVAGLYGTLYSAGGDKLGPASRDAWNEACEAFPPLAAFAAEALE